MSPRVKQLDVRRVPFSFLAAACNDVTKCVEQWERLLTFAGEIRRFAKDHDGELKKKVK